MDNGGTESQGVEIGEDRIHTLASTPSSSTSGCVSGQDDDCTDRLEHTERNGNIDERLCLSNVRY